MRRRSLVLSNSRHLVQWPLPALRSHDNRDRVPVIADSEPGSTSRYRHSIRGARNLLTIARRIEKQHTAKRHPHTGQGRRNRVKSQRQKTDALAHNDDEHGKRLRLGNTYCLWRGCSEDRQTPDETTDTEAACRSVRHERVRQETETGERRIGTPAPVTLAPTITLTITSIALNLTLHPKNLK